MGVHGRRDDGPVRRTASSGSPLEPVVGFARAVRVGPYVAVAGTAPLADDGSTVGAGDARVQTRRCFEIAISALTELGADAADVVRTRVMLTRIEDWREAADVHG